MGTFITVPAPPFVQYTLVESTAMSSGDWPEASATGWQTPPEHDPPWQPWPQRRQLAASLVRSVHMLPQQTGVDPEQATRFPHVVPHVAVEFRFVSQPSLMPPQSPHPLLQLIPHTPFVHDAVPFAVEHATLFAHVAPQVTVELRFVSQSAPLESQFAVRAAHAVHAPI
jgi:hypothetical protein